MAVKTSAADAVANWQSGFSGATTKYTAGVNAVTVAPGQLAAQQKAAYVANVQAQANVWATKTSAVSLEAWKSATTTIGAQRLATGAQKGATKMAAFMNNFLPVLSSVVSGLPARGTFDQNMARFQAYATSLHQKKGQF